MPLPRQVLPGSIHTLCLGRSEEDPEGEDLVGPVDSEAPDWCAHPEVDPKDRSTARKTQLRSAKRPCDWELGHHSFRSPLT